MYRIGLVAAGGSMIALMGPKTVYAQSENKKVKLSDLPIYDIEERQNTFSVEKESISHLRQYISEARKYTWTYFESFDQYITSAKDKFEIAKTHSQNAVENIRDDSAGFTRASIITVAGLGGIVLGYRGGVIRKLFYGSIAATSAAAFCYPKMTSEISSDAWQFAKTSTNELLYPTEKKETPDK